MRLRRNRRPEHRSASQTGSSSRVIKEYWSLRSEREKTTSWSLVCRRRLLSNIFQNIWSVLVPEPAVESSPSVSRSQTGETTTTGPRRRRESSVCSYVTLHHIWLIVTETWKFEFMTAGMNSDEWNKDFLRCTESSSVGLCWSLAAESLISLYSQRDARQRVNSPTALDESICRKNEVRGRSLMGLKRSVTSSLHVRRPTQWTCGSLSPQLNIILLFIFPGFGFCALQNSQIPHGV